MQFKQMHPNFQLPTRGTEHAGAYDLYMPSAGTVNLHDIPSEGLLMGLGFAAAVPVGFVALILPRSGAGAKHGVGLRNTVGVIDSDYRGEWMVKITQQELKEFGWAEGERLFQFILVPVLHMTPTLVEELPVTARGEGGFGSTGK